MSEVISVKDCLAKMDAGEVFSFKCITYNKQKKSGGKIEESFEARLLVKDTRIPTAETIANREARNAKRKTKYGTDWMTMKNPNHRKHYTRNIEVMFDGHPTGHIIKIHPPLLIEFNGIPVTP